MALPLALAGAFAVSAAALSAGWTLGGAGEMRVRTRLDGATGGDLDLSPRAGAVVGDRRARLEIGWAPRLVAREGGPTDLLQRGHALAEARLGGWTLSLSESARYGLTDFSPLTQAVLGELALQPLPSTGTFRVLGSDTAAAARVEATRRLAVDLSAGWTVAGGADAASRALLPLRRGPTAALRLTFAATHVDAAELGAAGARTLFSPRDAVSVGDLLVGYRRELSSVARLRLAAGLSGAALESGGSIRDLGPLPLVEGELSRRLASPGRGFDAALGARWGPVVDPVRRGVQERLLLSGSLGWTAGATSVATRVAGASGRPRLGPTVADSVAYGELTATRRLDARLSISAGLRGGWSRLAVPGAPSRGELALFVSLVADLREGGPWGS